MQKKIIALAIATLSGAAFAQSNVTISGNIDLGFQRVTQETAAAGKDAQNSYVGNGSSTSTIVFSGTENIGNGMNVGFLLASDFTAGAQNAGATQQMFNSQNYIQVGGGFGTLQAGIVNNTSLEASSASQPFGTAIGSGYSGTFGRLDGFSTAGNPAAVAIAGNSLGVNTAGARLVRSSQSAKYITPSFGGLQGTLVHVWKNNNDQFASMGQTELGLKYSNGPMNVVYAYTNMQGTDAANPANTLDGVGNVKHNMLGGNFAMGPATLYAGWTSSKGGAIAGADTINQTSYNFALKYAVSGNMAVMANILRANDKMVANEDRNLTGLGLDYSLSKRSVAYVRYEAGDNDKSLANDGKFTRMALGLRHAF
jgi:predicted porin